MQIPEPPPALGCSFSKSSKVNLQASWCTNKPEPIPQQRDVQEVPKETAEVVVQHELPLSTSEPSWMASVCKPPSLVLPRHLTILQDLGLPTPLPPFKLAGRTALHTLLFLIYINDISDITCVISSGKISVYANDIVLYQIVRSPMDYTYSAARCRLHINTVSLKARRLIGMLLP